MTYKLLKDGVCRIADGATIPSNEGNADWAEYQKWLALGNVPEQKALDPVPVDRSDIDNAEKSIKALAMTVAELTGTPMVTLKEKFKSHWAKL